MGSAAAGWSSTSETALLVTTTAVATATLLIFAKAVLWPLRPSVLPSPLHTVIPRMRKEKLDQLVYQPDTFPGARDVQTPYGSIRVYEYGPEDGEKVLFVHGISTSCITNFHLANGLVDRGCRVMLFDLFGRGFTDGVGDLPHDNRLYISQILLVLASSPLSWTGNNAFRLIGYSMGGGIAIPFTNTYPDMVSSLVLLAPSGLIRAEAFGAVTRFIFRSGFVPDGILAFLTGKRLQQPIAASRNNLESIPKPAAPTRTHTGSMIGNVLEKTRSIEIKDPAIELAVDEAADPANGEVVSPLERGVLQYVRWMVLHHAGFVPAFMSCVRHAPLTHQHHDWVELAKRVEQKPGTTAVFVAASDELIDAKDYTKDGLPLLGGKDKVNWKVLPGGHDFPMTHAGEIMNELDAFWGLRRQ